MIRFAVAVGFAVTVAAFFITTPTSAAQSKSANTLKVSPVRSDIEVPAGTRKVVQATVTNLADTPVRVTPVANDFIAGDERGTPALMLEEGQYAPTHSLKRFMSPLAPVTIPPKGSKTINVVVTVPVNAQAGGYFGAVRFMPTDPDEGGQVNLSPSVASLILLKVPGAIVEDLKVTTFAVQKGDAPSIYFQNPQDLQLALRFENKGNIQTAPLGKIQVRQGDEVIYEADFNTQNPHDMILPDSARRWEVPIKDVGSFGRYTATATFTYGEKNQTVEMTQVFWVAPLWVLFAIGGAVLLLLGLAILITILLIRRSGKNTRHPKLGKKKPALQPKRRFGR